MSNIITGRQFEQRASSQVSPRGIWLKQSAFMNASRAIGS